MGTRIISKVLIIITLAALALPILAYPADRAAGGRYDRVIAAEVTKKLHNDARLRDVRASVEDGVVTLTGSVVRYTDKATAQKKAGKVKNVADIRNLIAVRTENLSDAELARRLGRKLAYDPYGYSGRYGNGSMFNHLTLSVRDGVVTLGGEVRNESSRDYALAVTGNEKGVRGLVNQIRVLPTSIFDDDIRARAARAIYGDPVLSRYASDPGAPIRIVVENGHITLYGVVSNRMDSQVAEIRARGVSGAFSVENRLVVGKDVAY
jgi:osmotically-inducible protein OsmY